MYVNELKTKTYYQSITEDRLCSCCYCRSYRSQIRSAFPEISKYLDSLGIDIEKPFEVSPLDPDEDGMLEYCCCQYIVFGHCAPTYRHRIDTVEFRKATSYPGTGIEQEHFVLEFYPIKLRFDKGA